MGRGWRLVFTLNHSARCLCTVGTASAQSASGEALAGGIQEHKFYVHAVAQKREQSQFRLPEELLKILTADFAANRVGALCSRRLGALCSRRSRVQTWAGCPSIAIERSPAAAARRGLPRQKQGRPIPSQLLELP